MNSRMKLRNSLLSEKGQEKNRPDALTLRRSVYPNSVNEDYRDEKVIGTNKSVEDHWRFFTCSLGVSSST